MSENCCDVFPRLIFSYTNCGHLFNLTFPCKSWVLWKPGKDPGIWSGCWVIHHLREDGSVAELPQGEKWGLAANSPLTLLIPSYVRGHHRHWGSSYFVFCVFALREFLLYEKQKPKVFSSCRSPSLVVPGNQASFSTQCLQKITAKELLWDLFKKPEICSRNGILPGSNRVF